MSIKTSQAILKCFIDLKSSVWFTLGSEDETVFVSLRTFSGRLPVKIFKTLNGRQSHILSKFHIRKNSAALNYHRSWSWSNQPVLWDFYIMFLLVSSLWMFVTIFCPKHGVTGDVWRHNILTFHAASAENRREKSPRVSPGSDAELFMSRT